MSVESSSTNPIEEWRGRRCLVTGATGFIGRRLVDQLRAEGAFVRGLARSPAPSAAHELMLGDVADLPPNSPLLDGIDVAFHLAAKTHDMAEADDAEAEYQRVNVQGTAQLLALAVHSKCARFVFVSSVKAVDEGNERPAVESDTPRPLTAYGRSKMQAEGLVFETAATHGFEAVCLRFPLVYGPDQRGNLQRMIEAIDRGRFPPPPRNANRRSMLHVQNAVDALMCAGRHRSAPGHVYFVTDAAAYSTRDIYDAIRAALGRPPIQWSVPAWAFRAMAAGGDVARRIVRRRVGFDSSAYQKLLGSASYRIDRIQRELGFWPSHDLTSSLPAMIESHRKGAR